MEAIVVAQRCMAWFLTGLIWFVQVVHYPSFAGWESATFALQHRLHSRRTGVLVGPVMVGELVLSLITLLNPPETWGKASQERAVVASGLVAVAWGITFLIMVPLHNRLANGFDASAHRALVRWNWWRTVAWTARALLLVG